MRCDSSREPNHDWGDWHTWVKIHQRGAQWKQGVVICMLSYTSLLCNATPIHCTPFPLHPPLMNTQWSGRGPVSYLGQGRGPPAVRSARCAPWVRRNIVIDMS